MNKNKVYETMLDDITQVELKSQFDYDVDNGILIRKFRNGKPYNKPCGHKPICDGYGQIQIGKNKYSSHRLIWLYHYGEFPSEFIDHIDGDKMNNRIENLREADQVVNGHNQKPPSTNKSGFPRVCWHIRDNVWRVSIISGGKNYHIGYFIDYDDAVLASKMAKIKYHPSSPDAKKYADELGIEL